MPPKTDPEAHAVRLLRQFDIAKPPVPVDSVVKKLGLKLVATEFGDDVSGVLVVEDGKGVIGVNSSHSRLRQRFSIAHELGHFLLHSHKNRLFIDKQYFAAFRDSRSSTGESRREREANAFAASLLMPSAMLQEVIEDHRFDIADDEYLGTLAELFQVSKQALTFRVANLKLL